MNTNAVKSLAPHALLALALAAGGLFSPLAQAQQVYRIIGPDGKVTFSDQPPPAAAAAGAKVSAATPGAGAGGAAPTGLPFELRQIASKYPVTLYSGNDCGPCATAKSMLVNRGIPFSERTVITSEDFKALQRLSGDTSLPFATIGSQQLKGFSDVEWTQFLNAAGYPAASVLPSSYRPPAATPLVAVTAPPAANGGAARTAAAPAPAPTAPPPPTADNPAGIKF
ncbi:glutaredoxin family protein [Polaromonas sp. JS666]|uniref:glutaredoxin family protein n=1 Tax=Polaromonas sp. (strain JS666 / ATCC BAA-500) TaxID=296591 RepID=UPI00088EA07A|nr:glutaredoxin family protein [Polaromonas sp. JS666]SDM54206.1 Glutaredoxin [Polaromonas sp. JS666]